MYLKPRAGRLSLLALIAANGIAIWQFFANGGVILEVLWIYWLQSVVIGIINVYRILRTSLTIPGGLSTPFRLSSAGSAGAVTMLIRCMVAAFFILHYGIFHLVYAVFLAAFGSSEVAVTGIPREAAASGAIFNGSVSLSWIMLSGLIFALHHVMTLIIERRQMSRGGAEAPDIMQVMKRPYGRILPMHFIIISGPFIAAWFGDAMVFAAFMVLKTVVDVFLYFKGTSHPGTINPSRL